MGAIADGGVEVLSLDLIRDFGIPRQTVEQIAVRERLELERRDRVYRAGRQPASVNARIVLLIDDGLVIGSTMEAAICVLRTQAPAKVVVAVPVGPRETCERLRTIADQVVCLSMPEPFEAVGAWYEAFPQTTDDEIMRLLGPTRT